MPPARSGPVVFSNYSVAICAGSLVSGRSFEVTRFAIHGDLGARMLSVLFCKTCDLAHLLPPLWHRWGPSTDPGGIRSARRDTLGSGLDFCRFGVDFGTAF